MSNVKKKKLSNHSWLEINEECPRDMHAIRGLRKEGVVGVISNSN